jgi:TetR/AcrR family tetracycline transcriptional repressor
MKLAKAKIVAVALDLLDEVGLDAFSTRLLAKRLGVQQPALYWHSKNKRDLLTDMNAALMERHHEHRLPVAGQPWQEFVRANAGRFRRALLCVRDGARVHAGTEAEPEELPDIARVLAFMKTEGFAASDALGLIIAIGRYVVGCVLEEQAEPLPDEAKEALDKGAEAYPDVAEALARYRGRTPEQRFLDGLDLLIAGFETKRRR